MRIKWITAAAAATATIGMALGAAAQQAKPAAPTTITVYKTPT